MGEIGEPVPAPRESAAGGSPRARPEPGAGERELVRELVIELLAYQFASPVRWIRTVRELLASRVSRVLEVGPKRVLLPMLRAAVRSPGPLRPVFVCICV